jgi:hypothetical protein
MSAYHRVSACMDIMCRVTDSMPEDVIRDSKAKGQARSVSSGSIKLLTEGQRYCLHSYGCVLFVHRRCSGGIQTERRYAGQLSPYLAKTLAISVIRWVTSGVL